MAKWTAAANARLNSWEFDPVWSDYLAWGQEKPQDASYSNITVRRQLVNGDTFRDVYYLEDTILFTAEATGRFSGTSSNPTGNATSVRVYNASGVTLLTITGLNAPIGERSFMDAGTLESVARNGADSFFGSSVADLICGWAGPDYIQGNGGNDELYGYEKFSPGSYTDHDVLVGGPGRDYLDGCNGNDVLKGGLGIDTMLGGNGNDSYFVDNAGDTTREISVDFALGRTTTGGYDTVYAAVVYKLAEAEVSDYPDPAYVGITEKLVLLGSANINGAGNEVDNALVGNTGDNILTGNGGHDVLRGGAGADALRGGSGNDLYVADASDQPVLENAGAGFDTVYVAASYRLSPNVEKLGLAGTGDWRGVGNDIDNVIVGNSGNNPLDGYLGSDTLRGGDGKDLLIGGQGRDYLQGDGGDDTFFFGSVSESTVATRDTIYDFTSADRIDLRIIYAGTLSFIGESAFDGTAGQVRCADSVLQADLDGDSMADLEVLVRGSPVTEAGLLL